MKKNKPKFNKVHLIWAIPSVIVLLILAVSYIMEGQFTMVSEEDIPVEGYGHDDTRGECQTKLNKRTDNENNMARYCYSGCFEVTSAEMKCMVYHARKTGYGAGYKDPEWYFTYGYLKSYKATGNCPNPWANAGDEFLYKCGNGQASFPATSGLIGQPCTADSDCAGGNVCNTELFMMTCQVKVCTDADECATPICLADGSGYQPCSDQGGCMKLGTPILCTQGTECHNGECVLPPPVCGTTGTNEDEGCGGEDDDETWRLVIAIILIIVVIGLGIYAYYKLFSAHKKKWGKSPWRKN